MRHRGAYGLKRAVVKVLVACEFSGVVREAFRRKGHHAWSCDLLPASDCSEHHIQDDIRNLLVDPGWDLLIAHPPCTYLCNSGVRWLYGGKGTTRDPQRWAAMQEAVKLVKLLWCAPIPRIAIENPIMHRHAQNAFGFDYSQIIQPWQFGHPEIKATCLWLRSLPQLQPTNVVKGRSPRVHHESPGPDRWKRRSITYQGIADAMAEQWGDL